MMPNRTNSRIGKRVIMALNVPEEMACKEMNRACIFACKFYQTIDKVSVKIVKRLVNFFCKKSFGKIKSNINKFG